MCSIFLMAVDTVQWLSELINAPMMWTTIPGEATRVQPVPPWGIAFQRLGGTDPAWSPFVATTLQSHPIDDSMPKVVTPLTETRSTSQGFCERFKAQGQRLNPQFIATVNKGWANLGMHWNDAIERHANDAWRTISDVANRLFVVTIDDDVISAGGDPNIGYYQATVRRAHWTMPGMGPDDVVLWHTNGGESPHQRTALAVVSGVTLPGNAVVPPMHLQPLSLLPAFHPTSPGDHGHTSWWTAGPEAPWPLGSFHHDNNTVRPSDFRPAGTELTLPLSQDWPIVQHPNHL